MIEPAFTDFCRFAKLHVESGDIDPTYPVLKAVYRKRGCSPEQQLWFSLLYVTWYRLDSAEKAFERYPKPGRIDDLRLPTGTERRGFRGNGLAAATVNALMELARSTYGTLENWVGTLARAEGEGGWACLRRGFQQVAYCGPWASYKWADLLKNVHGYPITANDIGVGGGSPTAGPIPGMVRVTGQNWKRCATDIALQRSLLFKAQERLVPFSGLDQLETSLCDFNSLCKGRYYVGHDIDAQQEHFRHLELSKDWWEARLESFKPQYLGELQGWDGVRKHLNRRFVETGAV